MPAVPVSAAIWTDPRGSSVRVRGNMRYGKYFEPKEGYKYYHVRTFDEAMSMDTGELPVEIERVAVGVGWEVPIDELGNWKKNPLVLDDGGDFSPGLKVSKDEVFILETKENTKEPSYLNDWLSE